MATAAAQSPLDALAEQQRELSDLLSSLSNDDWEAPSACEGWSISDVVLHLAQTDEMALASVHGRFEEKLAELSEGIGFAEDVDAGAGLMVARDRGALAAQVHDRYETGAAALLDALCRADEGQRVTWVAGELRVRTLTTTRLTETWIHTGDIAAGVDVVIEPTDRLWHTARLAWRTLPYAFQRAGRTLRGPVAFELRSPGGETWTFTPDDPATTTITGAADELCGVAARRLDPAETSLSGSGTDAEAVLALVRTYA